jgi:hypothetical protein
MLDRLLARDAVTDAEIDRLAHVVAEFHRRADRGPRVRAAGSPEALVQQFLANFTDARPFVGPTFDAVLFERLARQADADVAALRPALEYRAADGRIVDGHGDLHARNVCLTDPPAIYDCIEFSEAFRCGDAATEIAFLTMDLRYRGHRALAERFARTYASAAADADVARLLPPLVRYRAMVRAKVAALAAADQDIGAGDRAAAADSARRHLRLAAATAIEAAAPLWIAACGPPASGKSLLLESLARETGWPLLQSDRIRKALAGVAPTMRLPAEAYAAAATDHTYATLLDEARTAGPVVLLDATWPTRARRASLWTAARAGGRRVLLVHLDVPAAVARDRLAHRAADPTAVSDADATVFERLAPRFEAPTDDEGTVVHLSGASAIGTLLDRVAAALL